MRIIPSLRDKKLIIEKDKKNFSKYISFSRYGKIEVKDLKENDVAVRVLLVNQTRESACYLIPGLQYEPVFEYIRRIMEEIDKHPQIKKTLMIGGAGFSFPKAYISRYGDKALDVVENNPEMIDIARKYFFLDRLCDEFELDKNGRMRIFVDDGLHYLQNTAEQYDLIINDAFVGRVPDKGLSADEGTRLIHARLREGGLYIINVITALTGKDAMPGIMAQELLARVFGSARMQQVSNGYPEHLSQNVLVVAEKN